MGVLQIDTRRERTNNLGAVRMASPDTGQLQAAQIEGAAKNRLYESRKNVGQSVASLGDSLLKASLSMIDFDRKIRADQFLMDYQNEINAYMQGDGSKENIGAINEDFENGMEWKAKIDKTMGETESRLRSKHEITDWEWKSRVQAMNNGFQEQWKARMATHAFQVNEKRSMAAATGRRKTIEDDLAFGDGTSERYGDWVKAMNEEASAHHAGLAKNLETGEYTVTDRGVYDQFMREGALRLTQAQFGNIIKTVVSETDGMENRKDVEDAFDERFKELKKEDGTYDFSGVVKDPMVAKALGAVGLAGKEKEFEADWKRAKRTAANNADTLFRQRRYQAHQDAQDAELKQMQVWDTQAQGGSPVLPEKKAEFYRELARKNRWEKKDGKEITEADGVQYPLQKYDKTAQLLYQKKAEYWDKQGQKESVQADKAMQKLSDNDWDNAAVAFLVMPKGDLTPEQREKWLDDRRHFEVEFYKAFDRGEISRETATRVQGLLDKHFTQEQEDAVTHLLGRFGVTVGMGQMFSTVDAAKNDLVTKSDATEIRGQQLALLDTKKGWLWDTERRIGSQSLGKYVQHFSYLLSKMPRGVDARQFAIDCEDEIVRMFIDEADTEEVINAMNIKFTRSESAEKMAQDKARADVDFLNVWKDKKESK